MTYDSAHSKQKQVGLTTVRFSDNLKITVPEGYGTWGLAIEDIWKNIEENITPDKAPKNAWVAFEKYALELVPKVTT